MSASGWVANSVNSVNGGNAIGRSIAFDAAGSIYVAGIYEGTMHFGSQTLTSAGDFDLFVSKFDSNGNFIWTKSAGGAGQDSTPRIVIGADGDAYLSGYSQGSANFGVHTLANGTGSTVAARLSATDGTFTWAQSLGLSDTRGIALDGAGRLTVGGILISGNAFMARLDTATGAATWIREFTPLALPGGNNVGGFEANQAGDIYFTTGFGLSKFDVDGNLVWEQSLNNPEGGAIELFEDQGLTYIYTQAGGDNRGVVKFADLGAEAAQVWERQGVGHSLGTAVDSAGAHYVIGGSTGAGDVVKLDPDGNIVLFQRTASEPSFIADVAVDASGAIYTTGKFEAPTTTFDTGTAIVPASSPTSGSSMFLLKATQDRGNIRGRAFNDLNNDGIWQFNDLDGNGVWDGNDTGEPSLSGATVYVDANANGQLDAGEPVATAGRNGDYRLDHVLPGSHTVRLVVPAGFTLSPPYANGVAVNVGAGTSQLGVDLAAHTATTWRNYASTDVPKKFPNRSSQFVDSVLNVSGNYTGFSVEATVTLTLPRSVTLIAPDGTAFGFSVPAGQTTVTVYSNDFNGKLAGGTWKLRLQGSDQAASTLTAWSLRILGPTNPPAPPGITVTPTSGLVTTEGGGAASFSVVLNSQPTADVTIGISSSDTTEGVASHSSLTFTPANWSTPQSVTVTGVNDLIVDGSVAYSIVTAAATSTDPAYNGLNAANVSVANQDNDRKGRLMLSADRMGAGDVSSPLSTTTAGVADVMAHAIALWSAMGADTSALSNLNIAVADSPGKQLGRVEEDTLWLDSDAAGWGWFIDPTPADDLEYALAGDQGEQGRIDLLSVVMHELGHLLGYEHEDEGVMAETLSVGVRSTAGAGRGADTSWNTSLFALFVAGEETPWNGSGIRGRHRKQS